MNLHNISQDTGVGNNLSDWYVGDAIFYTDDNRLPVEYDLSKWTVTNPAGEDITSQGTFTESDETIADKAAHVVKWTPTDTNALPENDVYTLNTLMVTTTDGIADDELDAGVSPYGTTEVKDYHEYTPDTDKHWTLDDKVTDNQVYLNGDLATATITTNLPDTSELANPLTKVVIDDDFTDFSDKVDFISAQVFENGMDVTDQYTIESKDGHVTATRKDASATPSGEAKLVTNFKIHDDIKDKTVLTNSGSVTVNSDTQPVPDAPIITWNPDPVKDVEVGTVEGDTEKTSDGKTVTKGENLTYPLSSDSLPADRVDDIISRQSKDTLDDDVDYQGFKAYLKEKDGTLTDITEHITATVNGKTVTFTEDQYLLDRYNADKSIEVTTPIFDVFVTTNKDNSEITNNYQLITNGHEDTSKTVTNHTPNPDPDKVNLNDDGVNIDGKTVLPGSNNNYQLTWDESVYEGSDVSDEQIGKGFFFVDDYPEEALDVDVSQVTLTSDGKAVEGVTVTQYNSINEAPKEVQAALKEAGLTPDGAFLFFSADDPQSFFETYAKAGQDITIKAPMTVKEAFSGEYENKAYQLDFRNAYETETVVNNVPEINPEKDVVVSLDDQTSLDGTEIGLGDTFDYKLQGAVLPADMGNPITQYGFQDDYDQEHDQYNGNYVVLLSTDVTLDDGTVLVKGTDVTKYTTQVIDQKNGSVDIEFTKEFLDSIDTEKSEFGADVYLQMTRHASGEVDNEYTNVINGVDYLSNRVTTTTPEPETPVTPETPATPETPVATTATPQVATPEPVNVSTPVQKETLPQTDEANENSIALVGLLGLLAGLGMFSLKDIFKKRKISK